MRRPGLPALLFCVALGPVAVGAAAVGSPAAPAIHRPMVVLIRIDGSINPAVADFVEDSLAAAARQKADALVIELDTPGGLLSSAQRIVKDLLAAPVPVIVYVSPPGASAASAGMFITVAANVAAMAPGTTIGAAHPVEAGGGDIGAVMGKKIENFAASFAKTVAAQRKRNQKWVEEAVRQSAAIGEREAVEQHVVDFEAQDLRELLVKASGIEVKAGDRTRTLRLSDAVVRRRQMRLGQKLLNILADPNIVYLLLMGGVIGLYFEFAHPGVFFPGVAGAICLLLALTSFQVLPINLSGLLLLLLGIGLLVAEAFITSYGILGIGGVVAFVLGSLFFINRSETNLVVSRSVIAGAAVAFTAITLGLGLLIARGWRGRAATGREGLLGEVGEVREPIAPGAPGRIFVHGEIWRAVADEAIAAGTRVRVTSVRGMELKVHPLTGPRGSENYSPG